MPMANEAVTIETPTKFARYTVADGTGIAVGTLLKLSGDNTAIASSADNDVFAGIAWEEKTASDGITEITAALNGVWDLKDSGAGITLGAICNVGGANLIIASAAADLLTGSVVGKVLETASASEVVRVRVGGVIV
jgi:hypothetical protein